MQSTTNSIVYSNDHCKINIFKKLRERKKHFPPTLKLSLSHHNEKFLILSRKKRALQHTQKKEENSKRNSSESSKATLKKRPIEMSIDSHQDWLMALESDFVFKNKEIRNRMCIVVYVCYIAYEFLCTSLRFIWFFFLI